MPKYNFTINQEIIHQLEVSVEADDMKSASRKIRDNWETKEISWDKHCETTILDKTYTHTGTDVETDFEIPVSRVGFGSRVIKVKASTPAEAEQKALEEAGNYEFSENVSDYKIQE